MYHKMVDITQLVECQVVVLKVTGSNPVIHPISFQVCSSMVEHWTFNPLVLGSNPSIPICLDSSVGRAKD